MSGLPVAGTELAAICEVLRGTQQPEGAVRRAAEQHLDEAASGSPNQLATNLAGVLAANGDLGAELRQEAAVVLRQLVDGSTGRDPIWDELEDQTRKTVMAQLLCALELNQSNLVKRNVGQAASAVANAIADDLPQLMREWPELLPALSRFVGAGGSCASRVVALEVLQELVPVFGEGLIEQGQQMIAMLRATLNDAESEVRAASVVLVLKLVEENGSEDALTEVMPAVVGALQSFVKGAHEEALKDALQALVSAAEEEPEFFKDTCMEALWPTLIELSAAGPEAFADPDVRHSAMEVAMSLAMGLAEEFSKPEGQPQLERLVGLNMEWMLEVEEDVEVWTAQGKDDNEDECDDDVVGYAEENMDRLAEKFDEDVLMPLLFKLIRAAGLAPNATWKHVRAGVVSISQVVEHILETAWVDQCVSFISQNLAHAHPRVRYAAFGAVGQVAYDHAPHVQETHHASLLPAVAVGLKDARIRVATNAAEAFSSLADELDCEDLEPHTEELLSVLFARLSHGETRAMQESCLSCIACVAEVLAELFEPYYGSVIPSLRQIIAGAVGEKERSLRGKAFECISLVGSVVGKDTFAQDAHEVMRVMTQMVQSGFAADDPQRESVRESAGRIAEALGKDFKPYVPALLPVIFETLRHQPEEIDPEDIPGDDSDDEQPDMSLKMINGKYLGLKTSVLDEMADSLDLVKTFIQSLEEEFCQFLPLTCQNLLPLLDIQLSEDLQGKAFRTWEALVQCAGSSIEHGYIDKSALQELVTVFLEKTVGSLRDTAEATTLDSDSLDVLQAKVIGVSGVVRKAGAGILTKDGVNNIFCIVLQLIRKIESKKGDSCEDAAPRRKSKAPPEEEDEDEDEEGTVATWQSLRFALADVAGSLMHTNPADFAEVALQPYMQLVQTLLENQMTQNAEHDRGMAFYITDDVVECLGEKSVPYWNSFMTQALQGMLDKSATVRQYAASTIGNGARHEIFAQMAPAAASQLHQILQKQGERHRRRRAVKTDAKQAALALDAGIRALGQICESHERALGGHAPAVWALWLSNLPLRYDQEAGQKAHAQLLALVSRGHPAVTSPQHLLQVVTVLAEVYSTKFSNAALDREIGAAVVSIGESSLEQLCVNLQEKHRKKIQHILHGTPVDV